MSNYKVNSPEKSRTITPELIIGGVFVAEKQAMVPVHHSEDFKDEHYGFTISEFKDDEGNIRASLLSVPAGGTTPAWLIKRPSLGYLEIHQVVSGKGIIVIKPREDDYTKSGLRTDEYGNTVFDPRSATHLLEADQTDIIRIMPGETFQVLADPAAPIQLLATMPKEPFSLDKEERVGSLL